MATESRCRCGSVNFLVYLLVIMFGVSSWVDINGLWVELPILVQSLPEGWDLPSYMSVIIQVANIAPLTYTVASTLCPQRKFEVPVNYAIISLGAVSCLLLAFLWDQTSFVAGKEHSVALFALQFCLALVDCTSSVAFLPFMSAFKPQYMTAYFVGEGFSGLIPSLVALGQGAGSIRCVQMPIFHNENTTNTTEMPFFHNENTTNTTEMPFFHNENTTNTTEMSMNTSPSHNQKLVFSEGRSFSKSFISDHNMTFSELDISFFPQYQAPRFSVRVFFLQLMFLMISSAVAFTLLNFWSYCQAERVDMSVRQPKHLQKMHLDSDYFESLTEDDDTQSVYLNQDSTTKCSVKCTKCSDKCTKYSDKCTSLCDESRSQTPVEINMHAPKVAPKFQFSSTESTKHSFQNEISTKFVSRKMSRLKYVLYIVLTAFLNAVSNGFLPSIQSYSCLPYGTHQYHLSVTLSSIANPVACLASFLFTMRSARLTVSMTVLGSCLTGYIVWTAYASPSPPLVGYSAGPVILILCWVLVVFVNTFTKVSIATEFRDEGKRALMWFGASTQAGSLLGAVATFVVINVFQLFETANPCM